VEPRVVSVQVGLARDYPGPPAWRSAFVKEPVAGRVLLTGRGLEGDECADLENHGTSGQAVLAYALAHYDLWREEIGLDAGPGGFAENLTVEGTDETTVCIGDLVRVGRALLEITYERTPCVKISNRWCRPDLTRRVGKTGRTGWYHRVVEPGEVGAGDAYELVERPLGARTVLETMRAR
jgi:MOSC domain-containing protein YiiM